MFPSLLQDHEPDHEYHVRQIKQSHAKMKTTQNGMSNVQANVNADTKSKQGMRN